MEQQMRRIDGRRYALSDGSEGYLVDAELLGELTNELGGRLMEPLKTTAVQNQRCMRGAGGGQELDIDAGAGGGVTDGVAQHVFDDMDEIGKRFSVLAG